MKLRCLNFNTLEWFFHSHYKYTWIIMYLTCRSFVGVYHSIISPPRTGVYWEENISNNGGKIWRKSTNIALSTTAVTTLQYWRIVIDQRFFTKDNRSHVHDFSSNNNNDLACVMCLKSVSAKTFLFVCYDFFVLIFNRILYLSKSQMFPMSDSLFFSWTYIHTILNDKKRKLRHRKISHTLDVYWFAIWYFIYKSKSIYFLLWTRCKTQFFYVVDDASILAGKRTNQTINIENYAHFPQH